MPLIYTVVIKIQTIKLCLSIKYNNHKSKISTSMHLLLFGKTSKDIDITITRARGSSDPVTPDQSLMHSPIEEFPSYFNNFLENMQAFAHTEVPAFLEVLSAKPKAKNLHDFCNENISGKNISDLLETATILSQLLTKNGAVENSIIRCTKIIVFFGSNEFPKFFSSLLRFTELKKNFDELSEKLKPSDFKDLENHIFAIERKLAEPFQCVTRLWLLLKTIHESDPKVSTLPELQNVFIAAIGLLREKLGLDGKQQPEKSTVRITLILSEVQVANVVANFMKVLEELLEERLTKIGKNSEIVISKIASASSEATSETKRRRANSTPTIAEASSDMSSSLPKAPFQVRETEEKQQAERCETQQLLDLVELFKRTSCSNCKEPEATGREIYRRRAISDAASQTLSTLPHQLPLAPTPAPQTSLESHEVNQSRPLPPTPAQHPQSKAKTPVPNAKMPPPIPPRSSKESSTVPPTPPSRPPRPLEVSSTVLQKQQTSPGKNSVFTSTTETTKQLPKSTGDGNKTQKHTAPPLAGQ